MCCNTSWLSWSCCPPSSCGTCSGSTPRWTFSPRRWGEPGVTCPAFCSSWDSCWWPTPWLWVGFTVLHVRKISSSMCEEEQIKNTLDKWLVINHTRSKFFFFLGVTVLVEFSLTRRRNFSVRRVFGIQMTFWHWQWNLTQINWTKSNCIKSQFPPINQQTSSRDGKAAERGTRLAPSTGQTNTCGYFYTDKQPFVKKEELLRCDPPMTLSCLPRCSNWKRQVDIITPTLFR